MRLICFYAETIDVKQADRHPGLMPQTRSLVERLGGELVACSGDDGYWRAMREAWRGGGFVGLEQDMLPTEDQLARLWRCPRPWCAYRYSLSSSYQAALGCTKFSDSLTQRLPELVDEVGMIDDDSFVPPRHWLRLDTRMHAALTGHGLEGPHVHPLTVLHLNPAQAVRA